jgi:hypothetical protein
VAIAREGEVAGSRVSVCKVASPIRKSGCKRISEFRVPAAAAFGRNRSEDAEGETIPVAKLRAPTMSFEIACSGGT